MKFIRYAAAAVLTVALCTACGKSQESEAEELAKKLVRESLTDPSSAQFQSIVVTKRMEEGVAQYCVGGEVNAKNRMGGYAGFSNFIIVFVLSPETKNQLVVVSTFFPVNDSEIVMFNHLKKCGMPGVPAWK